MTHAGERSGERIVVIGAGVGGLAAAIRLAAEGFEVCVIEAMGHAGGKMRALPTPAGPADAGPTVLTLLPVFEALFAAAGERLADHVTAHPLPVLARHWWPGGATLDLHADPEASAAAIRAFGGARAEADFRRFQARTRALYEAFEGPVIAAARPSLPGILAATLTRPALLPWLVPGRTLAGALAGAFRDRRLAQLFGRYATYVGGSPFLSPAVLALVWQAEARGVWAVAGGMSALAAALEGLARRLGVRFRFGTPAERVLVEWGRISGVRLADGRAERCDAVVFNGDPAALAAGRLGAAMRAAAPGADAAPRSHSAWVWSFAARPAGVDLSMHNVFFNADPKAEFDPLAQGRTPDDPVLYLCAQDRAAAAPPEGPERFEIILNAPATEAAAPRVTDREHEQCRIRTFETLARFGLTFDTLPGPAALTGPAQFARMFPGSRGALYGASPHGTLATFRRPVATTKVPGLYLAGGGCHPGAGVPMAAMSGLRAAEAIIAGRASTSRSRRTATPGGTLTASPTTARAPSR